MTDIARDDRLLLVVRLADTQVKAYLNGREIYSKYGYGLRPFEDRIEITPQLSKGLNSLLVLGVRWKRYFRFDVELLLNGDSIATYESTAPDPGSEEGVVWDFSHQFNLLG